MLIFSVFASVDTAYSGTIFDCELPDDIGAKIIPIDGTFVSFIPVYCGTNIITCIVYKKTINNKVHLTIDTWIDSLPVTYGTINQDARISLVL
jgi:hypothetical protein